MELWLVCRSRRRRRDAKRNVQEKAMINSSLCFCGREGLADGGFKRLHVMESQLLSCLKRCLPTFLPSSSSSRAPSFAPHLDTRACAVVFFKVWRMMTQSQGRGMKRERRGDEEIEDRISSAVCQPAPVGVFTRSRYLWTHVYPPRTHSMATLSCFPQIDQSAPQASVTS